MRKRGGPKGRPAFCHHELDRSGLRHVLGCRALGALYDVELHRVAFGERLEAVALDRTVVHEAVFLAAVGGNEPKALRVVEPLHLAGRTHVPLLRKLIV